MREPQTPAEYTLHQAARRIRARADRHEAAGRASFHDPEFAEVSEREFLIASILRSVADDLEGDPS